MVSFLQDFWWFLVLIGVMILFHELGHYLVGRFFDVKIDAKFAGEQPGDEQANDPRALPSKPRWQRLCITFAGPATNIVLAIALLAGLFMVQYPKIPMPPSPTVGFVAPDAAAAKAGIREGDKVVQIDSYVDPT